MNQYLNSKKPAFPTSNRLRSSYIKVIFILLGIVGFWFFMFFTVAFLMTRIAFLEMFLTLMPQEEMKGTNILAIGVDETRHTKRSDTIIFLHLDPTLKRIGAISIPRDTRVEVHGHGMSKINHAFAYGGVELLKETVSDLLDVPIKHHVVVNLNGLSSIIDELGGITIDVEKDLYYRDMAGDLYIDIKEGEQELDGDQAMQYLRYRHDHEGDIGRIRRQQTFMESVADKIIKTSGFIELPLMIKKLSNLIDTDLKTTELISMTVQFAESFRNGSVEKGTLPGSITMIDGVSYWKPNGTKSDQMINYLVHGFDSPLGDLEMVYEPSSNISEVKRKTPLIAAPITIEPVLEEDHFVYIEPPLVAEVLNGKGTAGLGAVVSSFLQQRRVEIFNVDNAGHYNYEKTLIVDWKGNTDRAMYLAKMLKIDPSNIIVYDKPDKPLDVTLVIGHDWDLLFQSIQDR